MGFRKGSIEKEIKDRLIQIAEEQDHISKDEIMREYFEPKTYLSGLAAKKRIDGIFAAVNTHFRKQGIIYCAVNVDNEWGIPLQSDEHEFKMRKAFKDIKARNETAKKVAGSARRLGYFKERLQIEEMDVPRLENGEEVEKEKTAD